MDHYLDIKLLPDPEFNGSMLMNALYGKLHRALVALKTQSIGVSFPQYQRKSKRLGIILRIHGLLNHLTALQDSDWLKGMRDHIALTEIKPVPEVIGYRQVARRQFKTNAARLRRRRMRRKGETEEQASQVILDSAVQKPDLPFLTLRSLSTGQTFCLFIDQADRKEAVEGEFGCYGLSRQATIPYF